MTILRWLVFVAVCWVARVVYDRWRRRRENAVRAQPRVAPTGTGPAPTLESGTLLPGVRGIAPPARALSDCVSEGLGPRILHRRPSRLVRIGELHPIDQAAVLEIMPHG